MVKEGTSVSVAALGVAVMAWGVEVDTVEAWEAWGMEVSSTPLGEEEVFSASGFSKPWRPCTPKAREALGWGVQEEGSTPMARGFSKLTRQGTARVLGASGGQEAAGLCTPLGCQQ